MKPNYVKLIGSLLVVVLLTACNQRKSDTGKNIIFLHHSTGEVIWSGNTSSPDSKVSLSLLLKEYNKANDETIRIKEQDFPKTFPYGWNNYPYDYYNIWVNNAGDKPYMEEPTLEILTENYGVIIFKHCFPVSNIQADLDSADINSEEKTISNYKLQYLALRDKLHQFPETKFVVFTGAAQVEYYIKEDEAARAGEFFDWVIKEWDLNDDNIFIWDLYSLQTEGGLYFKEEFALSPKDSHPNQEFAGRAVRLLFNRITDVASNNGKGTNIKGEKL